MIKAFLSFWLFAHDALGCTMDQEYAYTRARLKEQAQNATVAFTGLVFSENSDNSNYISQEVSWTRKLEGKVQVGMLCGASQIPGKRYLYLASDTKGSHRILIELEHAGLQMTQLSHRKDFIGEINPAWKYCKKDSSCVTVKDNCGNDLSIASENIGLFSEFMKSQLPTIKDKILDFVLFRKKAACSSKKSQENVINKCINYFCS